MALLSSEELRTPEACPESPYDGRAVQFRIRNWALLARSPPWERRGVRLSDSCFTAVSRVAVSDPVFHESHGYFLAPPGTMGVVIDTVLLTRFGSAVLD